MTVLRKQWLVSILFAGIFIWILPHPAQAKTAQQGGQPSPKPTDYQQLDLKKLLSMVITATRHKQCIENAPAIITVITARQIRERGYKSVADALRSVPGISIINDHTYQHIGVRGVFGDFETPNDTIKVMLNGQPVDFRPLGANFLGRSLVPIEAVKRIEVVRGPGSALYGANAFLGVVNIITFDGSESPRRNAVAGEFTYTSNEFHQDPGGSVSAYSGGTFGNFRYFAAGSFHRADRSGLALPGVADMAAQKFHKEDPSSYPVQKGWPSPGWDPATRERLLLNSPSANDMGQEASGYLITSYSFGKKGTISLDGNIQYMDHYGEFQEYSALTHANRVTYLNGFARLRYTLTPKTSGPGVSASVTVSGGRPTSDHLMDPLTPDSYKRRRFGYLAVDSAVEGSYMFAKGDFISAGLDLSVDRENLLTMEVVNTKTGNTYNEPGFGNKNFTNFGAYVQGAYTPLKGLFFTLGTRMDYNSVIGCNSDDWACAWSKNGRGKVRFSNRAGITWQPGVGGIYIKAIYGSSFRPPSPYQLYHNQTTIVGSKGNPKLLPQTAETIDFLFGTKPVSGLHVYADFYYTWIHDMVFSYLQGSSVHSRNANGRVYGLEGQVSWAWKQRLSLFANASYVLGGYIHPRRLPNETDALWAVSIFNDRIGLGQYPRLMVNGGINLRVPEGHVNVNLQVNYVGTRPASLVNNLLYNSTSLGKTYTLGGYFMGSITVSSLGLRWSGKETVLAAGIRYAPNTRVDPGVGGIDIPGIGPEFFLRCEQRF